MGRRVDKDERCLEESGERARSDAVALDHHFILLRRADGVEVARVDLHIVTARVSFRRVAKIVRHDAVHRGPRTGREQERGVPEVLELVAIRRPHELRRSAARVADDGHGGQAGRRQVHHLVHIRNPIDLLDGIHLLRARSARSARLVFIHADGEALLGATVEENARLQQHRRTHPSVDVVGVQVRRALPRRQLPHALHESVLRRDVAVESILDVFGDVPYELAHIVADGIVRQMGRRAEAVEPQAIVAAIVGICEVLGHIGPRRVPGIPEAGSFGAELLRLRVATLAVVNRREDGGVGVVGALRRVP